MKKLTGILAVACLSVLVITLSSCSKNDPEPVTTGQITGIVTDLNSGSTLADVMVIIFDAGTNSPVETTTTSSTGDYFFDLDPGNYFLKFYMQGYVSVPPPGIQAVPFSVAVAQITDQPAQMLPSTITNAGYIIGNVSDGTTVKSGVLVVAEGNGDAYSAISDIDGNYAIFNVPAATYQVQGYLAAYSTISASASVTANTATTGVDITMTQGASGQVAGSFKVISQTTILTPPTTMDISLVHPITKETIPGLSQSITYASSLTYSFADVPDGTYVVRATYANDYIVIDPDYVTKFGDYIVTITGGIPHLSSVDIVATSAVLLVGPTNDMANTVPVDVTSAPTFEWTAYASTSDYVIEVTDASTGTVIWGGFANAGGTITKNIIIPSNTISIEFNSDGNATAELVAGKVYRWRIFASKDDGQTGLWNLIAASEDQVGLIKVQ